MSIKHFEFEKTNFFDARNFFAKNVYVYILNIAISQYTLEFDFRHVRKEYNEF